MTHSDLRLAKWTRAKSHPEKVRESNARYRRSRPQHIRAQTAARMRRLRARRHALRQAIRMRCAR